MKRSHYHQDLMERLKDPKYALDYLNACLEDDDDGVFLLALRHVAEAHGGIRRLARKADVSREHLFRMLSKNGNPRFENLRQLVRSLGMKMMITQDKPAPLKKAA